MTPLWIAGLAVVALGLPIAWFRGAMAATATFAAGIVLIALAGARGPLSQLSLGKDGVSISFQYHEASGGQEDRRVANAILTLAGVVDEGEPGGNVRQDEVRDEVEKRYVGYFRSLGYVPTSLVGSAGLEPGAVLTFEQGTPLIWATREEAFKGLAVASRPSGLAELAHDKELVVDGKSDARVGVKEMFTFKCEQGTSKSVSWSALQASANTVLLTTMPSGKDCFVIIETIECGAWKFAVGYESLEGRKEQYAYSSPSPVVVAYRLAKILAEPAGAPPERMTERQGR